MMNVMQGIPLEIVAEFNSGLILGFFLTVISGLVTRIIDKQNLFLWSLGLALPTVIGSTLYYMWSISLDFYHYDVGPLGYLEGSLCGLWVIGVLITFLESQD